MMWWTLFVPWSSRSQGSRWRCGRDCCHRWRTDCWSHGWRCWWWAWRHLESTLLRTGQLKPGDAGRRRVQTFQSQDTTLPSVLQQLTLKRVHEKNFSLTEQQAVVSTPVSSVSLLPDSKGVFFPRWRMSYGFRFQPTEQKNPRRGVELPAVTSERELVWSCCQSSAVDSAGASGFSITSVGNPGLKRESGEGKAPNRESGLGLIIGW